jgi:hypothetical protein
LLPLVSKAKSYRDFGGFGDVITDQVNDRGEKIRENRRSCR